MSRGEWAWSARSSRPTSSGWPAQHPGRRRVQAGHGRARTSMMPARRRMTGTASGGWHAESSSASSSPGRATSAISRCGGCCRRRACRRSARSSSSITSVRRDSTPGHGVNVRPHPHIGLATVTYLFEGAFMHRDSLGTAQLIRPGDVNWMIAGRGIAHSERTPDEIREQDRRVEEARRRRLLRP